MIIPAGVRKLLGLEIGETVVFRIDEDQHVTVVPANTMPDRERSRTVKRYSDAHTAQILIDSAYTSDELNEAEEKIMAMGLNPKSFERYEPRD